MTDLVGASVGSYTITERVGRGGMAEVYKALHTGLSVHRALKVIRPEFVTADDFRARFQKEAQAVAQLRHPNIVQVHDFGTHAGAYYMVMEFIEGRDLKRILAAEGPIRPIRRAVDIVVRVANALEYAHGRGLIHRDIKPENVMMTGSGEPILTDFGIAKLVTSSTHLTQTGFGIGTPAYMAPEQAQGLTDVGPPADIYALTVVLFELLTGRVPFSADTPIAVIMKSLSDPLPLPRSLQSDISEALQAVVIKGTQKRPEDRYATVGAFRDALVEAAAVVTDQAGLDATVVRSVAAPTIAAPRPSSKALVGGTVAAMLVVAAGLGYWFTRGSATSEPAAVTTTSPSRAPVPPASDAQAPTASVTINGGTLVLDKTVTAQVSQPGERIEYSFDAEAGDTVYFDRADASAPTDFALIASDSSRVFETTADEGPVELPRSGQYRLVASPRGDAASPFEFVMRRLGTPVVDAGQIKPNTVIKGRTEVPGQIAQYRVRLSAGQTVRLAVDRVTAPTDFRLVDPNGNAEIFAADADTGELAVPTTGMYTLTVDPRFDRAAEFAFALRAPVTQRSPARAPAKEGTAPATVATKSAAPATPAPVRADAEPPPSTTADLELPASTTAASATAGIATPATSIAATPMTVAPAGGAGNQVAKGVTTQRELLRMFGGPNITTFNEAGLETWVYERTATQTDTTSTSQSVSGDLSFNLFFNVGQLGASASKDQSSSSAGARSTIRSVTVIVTFAPDRTVADYTVQESYF